MLDKVFRTLVQPLGPPVPDPTRSIRS